MVRNMTAVALLAMSAALVAHISTAVCPGDIEGILATSDDVCCVAECSACGGPNCGIQNATGLTAADCCVSEISESGILCDDSGAAPCIVTPEEAPANSTCNNGQTGVQDPDTNVCCPLTCGDNCGGEGCGTIPGTDPSNCCADEIFASGRVCSDTVDPPCVIEASAGNVSVTCSNGLTGYEDTLQGVCCDAACGMCGGVGCGEVVGLSSADCCSSTILTTGESCEVTGAAPCIIQPPEVTPSMCPNGIPGVADGIVCCAEACNGQCGGEGCGSLPGTNGPSDCCSTTIIAGGVMCNEGVSAPCIMVNGTYTNAPTMAPLPGATAAPTASSRGLSMAPTMMGMSTAPTMTGMTTAPTMMGMTTAPTMTTSMAPTGAPTTGSRALPTGIPTPSPTTVEQALETEAPTSATDRGIDTTSQPSAAPTFASGTLNPATTIPPATTSSPVEGGEGAGEDAAAHLSSGGLVTAVAMGAGALAIFAAARN